MLLHMTDLLSGRLRAASKMAALHLLLSAALAAAVAFLVFKLWFPSPYDELIHGRQLFLLITAVDVVCGPLLTLVLFDPLKPKHKWRIDIALIAITQCLALGYGLVQLSGSRPIFLALEGDRFRVVQAADVDSRQLTQAPTSLRDISWTGPRLLGVTLLEPTAPEYPISLQLAIQGLHPAFRPERWRPYEDMAEPLGNALRPVAEIISKYPDTQHELRQLEMDLGLAEQDLGYLPLVSHMITDWVVVLRRDNLQPVLFMNRDLW